MHGGGLLDQANATDVLLKLMSFGKLDLKPTDESVLAKLREQRQRAAKKLAEKDGPTTTLFCNTDRVVAKTAWGRSVVPTAHETSVPTFDAYLVSKFLN